MIQFDSVSKHFGAISVLKNISFTINEGEIVGILGPNGAGKTTTLRTLTGLLPPSRGKVTINNQDPLTEIEVRKNIGFLAENNPLYFDMTVEEWLKYWSKIKFGEIRQSEIDLSVDKSGVGEVYYRMINKLSKGYKQRVGLAQSILGSPSILVLDEPTEGLDPNQRQDIHTLIKDIGKKRTVLISSHVLSEITKMCSRVLIIHKGVIAADGSPSELSKKSNEQQIVKTLIKGKSILSNLKKLPGVSDVTEESTEDGATWFSLSSSSTKDLRSIVFDTAKTHNWTLLELTRQTVGLEEVFSQITHE